MARLEDVPLGERRMMESLDCSGFEDRRPWVKGPPLNERRVALLSTAALNVRGDAVYQREETSFRVIPGNVDPGDVVMSHSSVNFDRTGFQRDMNVCFPLQRLHELAAEGIIGSVADFHFTVSGAPHPADLEGSARAIARTLRADGVDTVLLVPIWPKCTRAVGGLAIYFEEEGLATTQISLIRIHSERTKPPRALWVPFELGRPLGVPNDPVFQKRVLRAAFELLDAERGPVLVDYPEDVPATSASPDAQSMEGMVCPVDFPAPPDPTAPTSEIGIALLRELAALAPWYDFAVTSRGRTTVGPSGLPIGEAGKYLAAFLEDQATACPRDDMPAARVLKLAYEDLKAYYTEAITAQPGYTTSKRVEDWLFNETVLGAALWRLRDICLAGEDKPYGYLGHNSVVPDRQINPAA